MGVTLGRRFFFFFVVVYCKYISFIFTITSPNFWNRSIINYLFSLSCFLFVNLSNSVWLRWLYVCPLCSRAHSWIHFIYEANKQNMAWSLTYLLLKVTFIFGSVNQCFLKVVSLLCVRFETGINNKKRK